MMAPATDGELATMLDDVAALIKKGWVQKKYDDAEGCFCLMGAVYRVARRWCASFRVADYDDVGPRMRQEIAKETGTAQLEAWNDEKRRTQAEVIEVVEKAARRLRDGSQQQGA